jgi:hypothetical protein
LAETWLVQLDTVAVPMIDAAMVDVSRDGVSVVEILMPVALV